MFRHGLRIISIMLILENITKSRIILLFQHILSFPYAKALGFTPSKGNGAEPFTILLTAD